MSETKSAPDLTELLSDFEYGVIECERTTGPFYRRPRPTDLAHMPILNRSSPRYRHFDVRPQHDEHCKLWRFMKLYPFLLAGYRR